MKINEPTVFVREMFTADPDTGSKVKLTGYYSNRRRLAPGRVEMRRPTGSAASREPRVIISVQ